MLGPVVRVLPILISISALGTANASLFNGGRYCMVGSQYGYLPEVFSCIHTTRLTPVAGIVFEVVSRNSMIFTRSIRFIFCVGSSCRCILYSKQRELVDRLFQLFILDFLCIDIRGHSVLQIHNEGRRASDQCTLHSSTRAGLRALVTHIGSYSADCPCASHCHLLGRGPTHRFAKHRLSRGWPAHPIGLVLLLSIRLPQDRTAMHE